MKKICVTGGAGFIGSHIVDACRRQGNEVFVVDDLSRGRRENLPPDIPLFRVDIDSSAFPDLIASERPQVIIHHAAQMDVRRSVDEPVFDAKVNILASIRMIEAARMAAADSIVYASTGGAVYGEPQQIPVTEAHPIVPMSPYGISKHTVEHYLEQYYQNHGLSYTVLRYGNVYGPRQDPHGEAGVVAIFSLRMLAGLDCRIFGDGSKTRDYVYIDDVVRANLMAIREPANCCLNLGTGKETTDQTIFDCLAQIAGYRKPPIYVAKRLGEIDRIALANDKIREIFGWTPEVDLGDGLQQAFDHYREFGDRYRL